MSRLQPTRFAVLALGSLLALAALPLGSVNAADQGTGPGSTVDFRLLRVGPQVVDVAPGETVTISATVHNRNLTTETFNIEVRTDRFAQAGLPSAASVTLAPDATQTITVDVTASTDNFWGDVEIRAVAVSDPNTYRYFITSLNAPVFVDLVLADTFLSPTGQAVSGTVTVTDLNGDPVGFVSGSATAFATTLLGDIEGAGATFTTDALGVGSFTIDGPIEHLPGDHVVVATVTPPGNLAVSDSAEYAVNPDLL